MRCYGLRLHRAEPSARRATVIQKIRRKRWRRRQKVKPMKTLGLALVALIAAMAMFGAANASAKEVLCKVKGETPCAVANQYALPRAVEASLQSTQLVWGNKPSGSLLISCQKSAIKGEAFASWTSAATGEQQIGQIKEMTETECTGPLGEKCTLEALQLPWRTHLTQKEPAEQGNANLYVGPELGGEQPGQRIKCSFFVECVYKSFEEQPKETNGKVWTKLQALGGEPAQLVAEAQLKRVSGPTSFCEPEGKWEAQYSVTNPNPLFFETA
jgi:hypothetical protein